MGKAQCQEWVEAKEAPTQASFVHVGRGGGEAAGGPAAAHPGDTGR